MPTPALAQFFSLQNEARALPGYPDLRAVYRQGRNDGHGYVQCELVVYVDCVAVFRKSFCYSDEAALDNAPEQMMGQLLQSVLLSGFKRSARQTAVLRASGQLAGGHSFMLPAQLLPSPYDGELLASSPQNAQ